MAEFHSRGRLTIVVVILVGVATVSMVVDRRAFQSGSRDLPSWASPLLDIAVPIQKVVSWPFDGIRSAWSNYVALIGIRAENEDLRRTRTRLEEENLQLREALVASGRLERIAEMREAFEVPMLPTELVGRDVSPWFHSVLLDRGRVDGVRSGMPVVSDDGLVGLVVATSHTAAKTKLLLDRQTAIDGTVQRSRARGITRGRGSDELEFEFVARGGDVQVGDLVITSGLGGVYPKGLLIGEVTSVSEPGSGLLRNAVLTPAVDFGRLEQAFVMLRRGPVMELLYSTETGDGDRLASNPEASE